MSPILETLKWVLLGVVIGGSVGYMLGYARAAYVSEMAMKLLQIEWQATLEALAKDKDR